MNNNIQIYAPGTEERVPINTLEDYYDYIREKSVIISGIKRTSWYNSRAAMNDLSEFEEIMDEISLRDQNGNLIKDKVAKAILEEREKKKKEDCRLD